MNSRLRTLGFLSSMLVLGACGSDDDDSASGGGRRSDAGSSETPTGGGGRDEDDVVTLLDAGVREDAGSGDGPRPNGEPCEDNADCVSGDCSESISGTKYCYGTAELGDECEITQDCAVGLCAGSLCTDPATLSPNGAACSDSSECASLECGMSVGGDSFCFGSVPNGSACAITQDCLSGVCRTGICADANACTVDAECSINAVCGSGVCTQSCGFNAVVVDGSCTCLPGFEWASNDPSDTNCVMPAVLPGCHVFAQNAQESYLGAVGDCVTIGSLCNPESTFGHPRSDISIFNPYGTFGSELGAYSAFNATTRTPPLMICDGAVAGCVTTNEDGCSDSTVNDPATLCDCQ